MFFNHIYYGNKLQFTMLVTTQWMYRKYWELNKKLFGGKLPQDITCKTSTNVERWGWAQCAFKIDDYGKLYASEFTIIMSNAYDSPEEVKENTLVHEMIHILDYVLHPDYYVYKDYKGWHHRKGYDAHGPVFFLKEAQRLQQYGYNIQRLVTAEEFDVSQLTNKVIQRQANKKAKGFVIGYMKYNKQVPDMQKRPADGMWFKTTENQLPKIVSNQLSLYNQYNGMHPIESFTAYVTHLEKYDDYQGCRDYVRGWSINNNEWNKMVDEMGDDKKLVMDKQINKVNESLDKIQNTKQKRQLTDGENGIGKINSDGSLTYIMM